MNNDTKTYNEAVKGLTAAKNNPATAARYTADADAPVACPYEAEYAMPDAAAVAATNLGFPGYSVAQLVETLATDEAPVEEVEAIVAAEINAAFDAYMAHLRSLRS